MRLLRREIEEYENWRGSWMIVSLLRVEVGYFGECLESDLKCVRKTRIPRLLVARM